MRSKSSFNKCNDLDLNEIKSSQCLLPSHQWKKGFFEVITLVWILQISPLSVIVFIVIEFLFHTHLKDCLSDLVEGCPPQKWQIIIVIVIIIIIKNNSNNNCIQRCSLRFFTISLLCRELSPTRTLKWPRHDRVKIGCNTLSAYHVHTLCATWYEGTDEL